MAQVDIKNHVRWHFKPSTPTTPSQPGLMCKGSDQSHMGVASRRTYNDPEEPSNNPRRKAVEASSANLLQTLQLHVPHAPPGHSTLKPFATPHVRPWPFQEWEEARDLDEHTGG